MPDISPVPTPGEVEQVAAELIRSRDAVMAQCSPLTPALWNAADGEGRWRVADIVEHLGLVEHAVLRSVDRLLQQPPDPEWQATLPQDLRLPAMAVDDQKLPAPERLLPSGAIPTAALLDEFVDARAATLMFLRFGDRPLKAHVRPHPAVGPLNGLQWLLMLAYHADRHHRQIARCLGQPLAASVPCSR